MSEELLGGGEVLALVKRSLEGSADLSLIIGGHLLLKDVEGLVDDGLNGGLRAGKNPNVLSLGNEVGVTGVDEGDGLVVGVEDTVVTSGGIGEELDLTLGTVEGGDGLGRADFVLNWVVLAVENSDGTISIEAVVSLLAIIGFPWHGGISCLLVPETHVLDGIEVHREDRRGAGPSGHTSIDNADEGKGCEDNRLEHDFDLVYLIL